jgi:hypothetical protein
MKIEEYKAARARVIEKLGKFFEDRGWRLVDDGKGTPLLEAPLTAGLHSNCPHTAKPEGEILRRYQINEVMKKSHEIRNVSLWCTSCESYVALLLEAVDARAAADQKLLS